MKTAVVLGAGFSHVAGLPLAKDLLDSSVYIFSKAAEQRYAHVWNVFGEWRKESPDSGPEQFLQYVYDNPVISGVSWSWAVELVAATLASPRGDDVPAIRNPRYAGQLTKPLGDEKHQRFWDILFQFSDISAVLTFNYDLLAERGIRHREFVRKPRPGFFYGGFERPQVCLGNQGPFSVHKPERKVELSGRIPLYKLHGSLSWALSGSRVEMYTDMRPAFRRRGEALIVPPVPEKTAPDWLRPVWAGGESALVGSERWIICGYSLPFYDYAARELFENAARTGSVREVVVMDPNSENLQKIWRDICPRAAVIPLSGIPGAFPDLREVLVPCATPNTSLHPTPARNAVWRG